MKYLIDILTNYSEDNTHTQVWVLNNYYSPDKDMNNTAVNILYSPNPIKKGADTEFPIDTIRDIQKYSDKMFMESYNQERRELGYQFDNDKRKYAVWDFYHNIKRGDIVLFVSKNIVYGYYYIVSNMVETTENETGILHTRKANVTKFAEPLVLSNYFGSPFLTKIRTNYGHDHVNFKEEITNALVDALNN